MEPVSIKAAEDEAEEMKCPVSHVPAATLLSREFASRPYPDFAKLQKEGGLHQVENLPWYLATGYDVCLAVLRDIESFSSEHDEFGPALAAIGIAPSPETVARMKKEGGNRGNMVDTIPHRDGAAHARQRRLVTKTITSGFFRWEKFIETQTAHLLKVFDGTPEIDVVAKIAVPLPVVVIADVLGVADEYVPKIKAWSDDSSLTSGRRPSEEDWERQSRAMVAMRRLFETELRKRLADPSDDLVGRTAAATLEGGDKETGDAPLSFEEAVDLLSVLLLAGNETTTQFLAGLLYNAATTDLLDRVRADETVIDNILEETLRLTTPITTMMRFCKRDTVVQGVAIKAGSIVSVCFNQASRDPAVFDNADAFDPNRENLRRHLAFGKGVHVCPGAPLARLEGRVLLKRLAETVKSMKLSGPDTVKYDMASLGVRGMTSMKVSYELLKQKVTHSGEVA